MSFISELFGSIFSQQFTGTPIATVTSNGLNQYGTYDLRQIGVNPQQLAPLQFSSFTNLNNTGRTALRSLLTSENAVFQLVGDVFTFADAQSSQFGTIRSSWIPNYSDPFSAGNNLANMYGFDLNTRYQVATLANDIANGLDGEEKKNALKGFFSWIVQNWKAILTGVIVVGSYLESLKNKNGNASNTSGAIIDPSTGEVITPSPIGYDPRTSVQAGGGIGQVGDFVSQNFVPIAVLGTAAYLITTKDKKKRKR